jgi:hypothetical protein
MKVRRVIGWALSRQLSWAGEESLSAMDRCVRGGSGIGGWVVIVVVSTGHCSWCRGAVIGEGWDEMFVIRRRRRRRSLGCGAALEVCFRRELKKTRC